MKTAFSQSPKNIKDVLAGITLFILTVLGGTLLFWQASAAQTVNLTPPTPDVTVNLLAVGDIMLGRDVQKSADASLEKADYPFAQIKSLTSNVDISFANLESPLVSPANAAHPQTKGYEFPGRPDDALALKKGGFDLVTLANNHSLDFGTAGLNDTITALQKAGVNYIGAGKNSDEAESIRYLSKNGLKIAFIAATQAWPSALNPADKATAPIALFDQQRLLAQIREARSKADVVVVALHWGDEYSGMANELQRQFVQQASQAGADLILGAHPHVLQPFEAVGHTVVAYSLGNFIFDGRWPPETNQSAALFVKLDKKGVASAQVIPLQIENNRPRELKPEERAAALTKLAQLTPANSPLAAQSTFWNGESWQSSPALAYVRAIDPDGKIVLPTERTIAVQDVTGDSPGYAQGLSSAPYSTAPKVEERLQLSQQHLKVWRQDGQGHWQIIWQSPLDWSVMQFTFADADNDGRPEIMFTHWKNTGWDDAETYRNHPFVYGWRTITDPKSHDQYPAIRPVWAGSALFQPFPEFALSDFKNGQNSALDGAHNQLVVLEGRYNEERDAPARSVVIFDWNGWGFTSAYRSPVGTYAALNYAPGQSYIFYKSFGS